jgi:nucleoside phosphorylase
MRRLERRPTGLSRLPERPRRELLRRLEAKNVAVGDIACNEVVVDDASLRNRIHQETGAFAATFETAAVGAVAEEYEIPWLSFRVVTDTASGAAALQFARTVARETASLYDWIVDLVEYGWFDTFREASDGKGGSRCFDSSSLG